MPLNINDPTFNAGQIVGQYLIAKAKVLVYDSPWDNAQLIGSYAPGQTVGLVDSWLDANPANGRSHLFWQFIGQYGSYYYAPHFIGEFDVQALADAGALTTGQQTQAAIDASKTDLQKFFDSIQTYIPWIVGGALGIALIGTVLKNKK